MISPISPFWMRCGQFLERPAVARHQSHADFEVLGRGLLGELSMRLLVGPSAVTGFSMNTFRPFSMA